ncbi:Cys-Gln thioester bond-forming surface protein [Streptomyces spectabilis]|uniref:TQXA domain-containing protein/LPXTG-motif cell wall-anchored protein n=1 Tax=Streptomyces spectabilis TaxID=68270 RepID=A0A7W8EUS7_STRST|nr:Cys-Gln thioester bond-forming surface protein [Streptomyces spectabilis]MBB5106182.1 TQXA domain-containing protein/LPXTG-motif cell wall-anchored protein [Streptomyces spectabilis]MCI3902795.1 Cys-Gln thioester bond-forming surface protein [Streptomyces spectabilis]
MFAALSIRGRGAVRLAAALVASGLVSAGATATASAAVATDAPPYRGGATATLDGLTTYGQAVIREDGGSQRVPAGLFEMSVDNGGTLQTYCVDLHNPTQKDAQYKETPWRGTSLHANRDAGKIRWILQHSYPQVNDLAELARKAGAGSLTEETAAAGTQVAIWRYSDKADKTDKADRAAKAEVEAVDPRAEKLADYLERSARRSPEPKASLTLEPPAVSGRAGERLGPVTVRTDADSVTVTPPADSASGVKVVGKNGKPVTSASDGGKLYFAVPKGTPDGMASLEVQASTTVPVGRAFTSETRSQTQILAGSSESTVSATATAHWAAKGPIPALSAEKNCAERGVDITAANKGDAPFTFSLMGAKHTIKAGETRTVTIPLQEDQAYDFAITGPGGFEKRFTGVLDCRTEAAMVGVGGKAQPAPQPSPASAGGTSGGGDLAATGGSNATPLIAGLAIALVVVGGGAVFLLRKKKDPAGTGEAAPTEE